MAKNDWWKREQAEMRAQKAAVIKSLQTTTPEALDKPEPGSAPKHKRKGPTADAVLHDLRTEALKTGTARRGPVTCRRGALIRDVSKRVEDLTEFKVIYAIHGLRCTKIEAACIVDPDTMRTVAGKYDMADAQSYIDVYNRIRNP